MIEYELISLYYGDRKAKRSGVPYINHITEGLSILSNIKSTEMAARAFCTHPMVQSDVDLVYNYPNLSYLDGRVIALALEYRRVANNYLSTRKISHFSEIELSPLYEVNDMLFADKIQNKKDFMKYHYGIHPRSEELLNYFNNWISRLTYIAA